MILEDVFNHISDMPGLSLPVYILQFPDDVVSCICIFPTGGGVSGNIGVRPGQMTGADGVEYMDYPGIQIQVRYTDPYNAFRIAENIRQWLDDNLPPGYIRCDTTRSLPDDLTNQNDIALMGGPAYRFSVDFSLIKMR